MSNSKERQERVRQAEKALESVICRMHPSRDGKAVSDALLRRFGSPGAVIEAGKHQLMQEGLSEADALLLSMLPDIIRHMERAKFGEHPSVSTLLEAQDYLSMRYIGQSIEQFYLLALDSSGKLIECIHMQSGNEDSAPFYMKHVLAEVVRTRAQALVISHNHPNITPRPSQADIECTAALIEALSVLNTPLLDHMIMVDRKAVSVRGFGYIPEQRWLAQATGNRILQNWLTGWDPMAAADEFARKSK